MLVGFLAGFSAFGFLVLVVAVLATATDPETRPPLEYDAVVEYEARRDALVSARHMFDPAVTYPGALVCERFNDRLMELAEDSWPASEVEA